MLSKSKSDTTNLFVAFYLNLSKNVSTSTGSSDNYIKHNF